MELHVIPILLHLLMLDVCYYGFKSGYRYMLHPDYRWEQRGNICYDHARNFGLFWGLALFLALALIVHGVVRFSWF